MKLQQKSSTRKQTKKIDQKLKKQRKFVNKSKKCKKYKKQGIRPKPSQKLQKKQQFYIEQYAKAIQVKKQYERAKKMGIFQDKRFISQRQRQKLSTKGHVKQAEQLISQQNDTQTKRSDEQAQRQKQFYILQISDDESKSENEEQQLVNANQKLSQSKITVLQALTKFSVKDIQLIAAKQVTREYALKKLVQLYIISDGEYKKPCFVFFKLTEQQIRKMKGQKMNLKLRILPFLSLDQERVQRQKQNKLFSWPQNTFIYLNNNLVSPLTKQSDKIQFYKKTSSPFLVGQNQLQINSKSLSDRSKEQLMNFHHWKKNGFLVILFLEQLNSNLKQVTQQASVPTKKVSSSFPHSNFLKQT